MRSDQRHHERRGSARGDERRDLSLGRRGGQETRGEQGRAAARAAVLRHVPLAMMSPLGGTRAPRAPGGASPTRIAALDLDALAHLAEHSEVVDERRREQRVLAPAPNEVVRAAASERRAAPGVVGQGQEHSRGRWPHEMRRARSNSCARRTGAPPSTTTRARVSTTTGRARACARSARSAAARRVRLARTCYASRWCSCRRGRSPRCTRRARASSRRRTACT